jgi:hypothetical protein
MKYCTDTWLIWKESLVTCWINQFPHFGVTVTSPIEGCHATLKTYLQRGHSDLQTVFNRMKLFWIHQQSMIQSTVAQQKLQPKHSKILLFLLLFSSISIVMHHRRSFRSTQSFLLRGSTLLAYATAQSSNQLAYLATILSGKGRQYKVVEWFSLLISTLTGTILAQNQCLLANQVYPTLFQS